MIVTAHGRHGAAALVLATLMSTGCAALEMAAVAETHRLEEGEFYVSPGGSTLPTVSSAVILPASLDPALATSLSYGRRAAEFAPILAAINDALGRQSCCALARDVALPAGAPHVYVGSADGELAPPEAEQQVMPHDRFAPMVLHIARPSAAWQQSAASLLAARGAQHAIVVTLGVSQYPKGREGVFGKKVMLGTGHEEPIEFLSAEDKLLEVLQLTGMLVDAQGRVLRAGAEGILARDTPFAAQVIEVEKAIDDRTLEKVLTTERRDDLPGSPAKWDVALENLLAQLRGDRQALVVP
jgi:hypothetical protein